MGNMINNQMDIPIATDYHISLRYYINNKRYIANIWIDGRFSIWYGNQIIFLIDKMANKVNKVNAYSLVCCDDK